MSTTGLVGIGVIRPYLVIAKRITDSLTDPRLIITLQTLIAAGMVAQVGRTPEHSQMAEDDPIIMPRKMSYILCNVYGILVASNSAVKFRSNLQGGKITVSFQAYLDKVEEITGKTPQQFVEMAREKDLTEHKEILSWLKTDYGLGTGHARAIAHVILHGPEFELRHTTGTHRDESGTLKLDGKKK